MHIQKFDLEIRTECRTQEKIIFTCLGLFVEFPSRSRKMVGFPESCITLCVQSTVAVKDTNTEIAQQV
jgi:hypothetical protein